MTIEWEQYRLRNLIILLETVLEEDDLDALGIGEERREEIERRLVNLRRRLAELQDNSP